jgi:ankyrin repeat protein
MGSFDRVLVLVALLTGAVGCTDPGAAALCDAIQARDVARAEAALRAGPVDWLRQQWTCQPAKDAIDLAGEGAAEGTQILQAMLRAGLDPDATFNLIASTPGLSASSRSGRSAGSTTSSTHSLAEWAAGRSADDVVIALRAAGLDMTSERTAQAVVIAARNGDLELLQLLVEAGAPLNATTGPTALGSAVAERHHAVIAYLESKGARESPGSHRALFHAARTGDVAAVKAALAAGVDANAEDLHDDAVLLRASAFGQAGVVEALLAAGADPNQWSSGESALQAAAQEGHAAVIRALLSGKASANARFDDASDTALARAVQAGHVEAVQALLAGGADPAIPGATGPPLRFAVQQKHLAMVQALLGARADPNHTSHPNEPSMLHDAVIGCQSQDFDVLLVGALVAAGARLGAIDSEGKTARQQAEARLAGEARPFYKACYEARISALKALGG